MNDSKKQFECAICSETFQKPKSLPCLHTLCEDCLDELLQTQKSKKLPLSCPYCKKKYPNISTVKDFPINFLVESTTEIVNAVASKEVDNKDTNPSIYCTRCREEYDEHNDAVKYCQDCQLPLCDGHVILHQKNKNTKDHSLVPVDQVSKDQLSNIKKPSPRCSKNRGEKL
jgi:tripartite motif-containing protein 2/3